MTDPACANCGEPHDPDDVFCENCGFDFLTGSLPSAEPAVTSVAGGGPALDTDAAATTLTISADRAYHERMDTEGVLTFPDPPPDPTVVPIVGATVLIGRNRPSKRLFPDVDLSSDPAVSSRHAVLERDPAGNWTITDLDSTNGTYLGASTVALEPHSPVALEPGTPIHVGAWTRLDLSTEA